MILNLGAGEKRYLGAVNIDIVDGEGIDEVVDLKVYPWKWKDNSIDGIHLSHVLEHILDYEKFLRECHRILKPGGFFRIVGPHCTSMSSVGCLGHYRTFSADTFHRYLSGGGRHDKYLFDGIKFETKYYRVNWVWEETISNGGKRFPFHYRVLLRPLDFVISKLINISHRMFERFWWPLVGGASEVVWEGVKV